MHNKDSLIHDVYYQKEYLSLYLKEGEEIFEFELREKDNFFYNIGIKRPIKKVGLTEVNDGCFDLETVYGYGGIICNSNDLNFIEKAKDLYKKKIKEEKIIAEFARVHPFNNNTDFFKSYYDFFVLDRQTVVVNTAIASSERRALYSSTTRNIVKNAHKVLQFQQSNDIGAFYKLYEQTMHRNSADDFYFFSKKYFKELLKLKDTFLFIAKYNDVLVSASFAMFSYEFGHYHLSANNNEYRNLNGNYFLLDSMFEFAHSKRIKYFHLGGGRTNKIDDLLFGFKQKFSKETKDFYIGGKIHNKLVYDKYNTLWKSQNPQDRSYFLKYRLAAT